MTAESHSVPDTFADLLATLGPVSEGAGLERWTTSLVVDFGAVDHYRTISTMHTLDGDALEVNIIRRDEYDLSVQPVTVVRGPVEISVAGFRFSAESCREFTRLLLRAADEVDRP